MDHDISQPWTTTRCNRLLRPLLTHVAALRRELKWGVSVATSGVEGPSQSNDAKESSSSKRSLSESTATERPAKRIRHTYSKRDRTKSSHVQASSTVSQNVPVRKQQQPRPKPSASESCELLLPTPFLRRVRRSLPSCPLQPPSHGTVQQPSFPISPNETDIRTKKGCAHPNKDCQRSCAIETALSAWKLSVSDQVLRSTHESIFRALESLLRATSPQRNHAAGSRSLVAMCLRKVPAYIGELEYWEKKDADENGTKSAISGSTASSEVYTELESLGAVDGWRHLCIVVRAHGIRILAEAVSESVIDLIFSAMLIKLVDQYMPHHESVALYDAHLMRQYRAPSSIEDNLWYHSNAMLPLHALQGLDKMGSNDAIRMAWGNADLDNNKALESIGLNPLGLAKMNELLSRQLLPPAWILTIEFRPIWTSVTRFIAGKQSSDHVLDFAITCLTSFCRLQYSRGRQAAAANFRTAAHKTFISALTTLASISLLDQTGSDHRKDNRQQINSRNGSISSIIGQRVEFIIQSCQADLRTTNTTLRHLHIYLLSLCALICNASTQHSTTIFSAWTKLSERPESDAWLQHYEATLSILCAIAHCYSRGTGLPPNTCLVELCEKLDVLSLPGNPLKNMRVDGAFRLAEQTGDLRDLLFAESLGAERTTSVQGENLGNRSEQTPLRRTTFSGFRWDEGLSEWVTASPLLARGGEKPVSKVLTRLRSHDASLKETGQAGGDTHDPDNSGSDADGSSADRRDTLIASAHPSQKRQSWPQSSVSAESSASRHSTSNDKRATLDEECFRSKKQKCGGPAVLRTDQNSRRRSSRRSSGEQGGEAHDTGAGAARASDELGMDPFEKENEVGSDRAKVGKGQRVKCVEVSRDHPSKRVGVRRSLQSRQPLRRISNVCFQGGGSSDDELGM